jgi:hypothetical protein
MLLAAGCCLSIVLAVWGPPRQLTFDANPALIGAGNAKFLAACGTGTLQAIWYDGRDGGFKIYGKRSTDAGLTWSDDEDLSQNPDTAWCSSVVGNDSMLHLMYRAKRGSWSVCYRRSTNEGATWQAETVLVPGISFAGGNVTNAAVDQYVHVLWPTYVSADNTEIYYLRSTNQGSSWLPEVRLTSDSARSEDPAVAVSGAYVHLVWYETRTGSGNPFYKRSTDNGATWGSDVQLAADTTFSYFPMVAAAESAVHLAWTVNRGTGTHIRYRRSDDFGVTWGADAQMDSSNGSVSFPVLTATGSNVHLVWSDRRSGKSQVYHRLSTDCGVDWSREETLTYSSSNSSGPAMVALGSLLNVTYCNDSTGVSQVWYLRNPSGNVGTEDSFKPQAPSHWSATTIIRGILFLTPASGVKRGASGVLLDISGRGVLDLTPGANDVSRLAPGVYFVHSTVDARHSTITKVVIAR